MRGPSGADPVHLPTGGVDVRGILGVLEDMAAEVGGGQEDVTEQFAWLGVRTIPELSGGSEATATIAAEVADRFGAIDAIRPQTRSLRLGYGWVAGQIEVDGAATRVFEPLTTMVVEVSGDDQLRRFGDLELTPRITDPDVRDRLEMRATWGAQGFLSQPDQLQAAELLGPEVQHVIGWLQDIAAAAGFDVTGGVEAGGAAPSQHMARDDLHVIVGLGMYAMRARPQFSPAATLSLWQRDIGTSWTALHSLYLDHAPPATTTAPLNLPSAYQLTEAQQQAVSASRVAPVTVIAGAPGTGKTHTIAAIVGDAVAHGRSVLVAAKADASVEAILEVLARRPGPDPVVFGGGPRRAHLASRLAAGQPAPAPAQQVDAAWTAMLASQTRRDAIWSDVIAALSGIRFLADDGPGRSLRQRMPGLATADLLWLHTALPGLGDDRPPWWRRGARQRHDEILQQLGVPLLPEAADRQAVIELATAAQRMHQRPHPLSDGLDWRGLASSAAEVQVRTGEWMDVYARHEARHDRHSRGTLGALARALRAGRATRRAGLAQLVGQRVTTPLPVWVGTLGDIDDLLPRQPAMFDLVVLDEASSIDQPRAATALLRAAAAVVVGDPQQLRHVSFVAARATQQALQAHVPTGSPTLHAKLDVRAQSIFDVAASTTQVRVLDEHFRGAPHLFALVGERLYRGEVSLATRTPLTDREDRISLTRLDAARNADKVVEAEVDWVARRLEELRQQGATSVGVVSPFRAQADAIEARALAELGRAGIQQLGLRVGTVHAFQGMERDIVLASVGVGRDDGARTWSFVNDPHLFAVFATRARERMELVISADPPPNSLLDEYVGQVDHPPPPLSGIAAGVDLWTRAIAEAVQDAGAQVGVQVVAPYPAGRHLLDLVIHDSHRCLGVETRLHPAGPSAHARRHVELAESGWTLLAAHRAAWDGRAAEAAVALVQALSRLP